MFSEQYSFSFDIEQLRLEEIISLQARHTVLLNEFMFYHETQECEHCGRELPDTDEEWDCSCGAHFEPLNPQDDWLQDEQERERMCPVPSPWERDDDTISQAPRPLSSLPAGVRYQPYQCGPVSDSYLGYTSWELQLHAWATR